MQHQSYHAAFAGQPMPAYGRIRDCHMQSFSMGITLPPAAARLRETALLSRMGDQEPPCATVRRTPNTNHIGFYVAKAKGLYTAAGLNVTLLSPHHDEYKRTPASRCASPANRAASPARLKNLCIYLPPVRGDAA